VIATRYAAASRTLAFEVAVMKLKDTAKAFGGPHRGDRAELCRLAASVPLPRLHTVRYSGVIGSASTPSGITKRVKLRSRVVPTPPIASDVKAADDADACKRKGRYRPWAELMMRTMQIDVLECPRCHGHMKLLALVTDLDEARRFARELGEPTELAPRTPARGPPYWQSRALRRLAGEAA